jgi:ABC-type transport system substrate-binding protein
VTPGGPDAAAELDRLIASFRDVGVELQPVGDEPGRIEDASWGPVEPATEVDGHLYGAYRSGQPSNRSLVSDPRLDALLEAQRRAGSRRERKALIDDVQRLVADQVYYLFPPAPQQIASWAPWVRGYQPRAAKDPGAQLESVWVTRRA